MYDYAKPKPLNASRSNRQRTQARHLLGHTMQRQMMPAKTADSFGDSFNGGLQNQWENKTSLPDNLKYNMEHLTGVDLSDVKVHRHSDKPRAIGALAYTQGSNIYLESGQERHLGHELGHVAQQKQGRVKPTMQIKPGVNLNDDSRLEKEADQLGALAAKN